MYAAIASFLNAVNLLIKNISNAAAFAANPVGSLLGTNSTTKANEEQTTEDTSGNTPLPTETKSTQVPETITTVGRKRSLITLPEKINARFNDTGSPAWKNQPGGKHLGTDFGALVGSAVYAPYDMHIVKLGAYTDAGRKGDYIIGTLGDGTQYYTGHLSGTLIKSGQFVKAGTRIASIGFYNHTHIQMRVNGALYDPERYFREHP